MTRLHWLATDNGVGLKGPNIMTIIVRIFNGADQSARFTAPTYRDAVAQLSRYSGMTARIYCKSGDGVTLVAELKAGV